MQASLVNKFNSILSRSKRAPQIRLGRLDQTSEESAQSLIRLLDNEVNLNQDNDPQLSKLLDTLKEMMQEEEQEKKSLVKSSRKEVKSHPIKVSEASSGLPPPPDTVTHEELAPPAPGCRSIATTTCHHKPNVVSRRKGYEECRKVPTVDCFLVLKTVPDLECSPEAYEDCIDVAKEVPYFEPQEECFQVPFEVCSLVEEEVPTKVCTLVDPNRESKVLAKKELKRDRKPGAVPLTSSDSSGKIRDI